MRRTIHALLAIAAAAASGASWADTLRHEYDFQLERQPLKVVLIEFSKQTGVDISFLTKDSDQDDVVVGPLKGHYTAESALSSLLEGTGLTFTRVGELKVAVTVKGGEAAGSSANRVDTITGAPHLLQLTDQAGGREEAVRGRAIGAGAESATVVPKAAVGYGLSTEQLEEVIVTGTYIKGVAPAGSALRVYSRQDLSQSGAATIDQFARQMTENFATVDGIANANSNARFSAFGQGSGNNTFQGTGFNLHGVGPSATLTLLNGQRLAPAGFDASIVDVSHIPLSAVERIEVMTDGASAIYGADAIAGVVNIITRRDFTGGETALNYGGTEEGGYSGLTASQLLGTSWDSGNAFVGYEYGDQDGLDASQRDYVPDQGGPYLLIPENRRNSAFMDARQLLGERTTISATASYSDRDFSMASSSAGTFRQQSVSTGNAQQVTATLGAEYNVAGDWRVQATGNYARMRQDVQGANQTITPATTISSRSEGGADADISGGDILVSGSLFELSGDRVRAALGGSYREEAFDSITSTTTGPTTTAFAIPEMERDVTSAYAEIFVPLVGSSGAMPGIRRLELSAAVRYDDYSDFGSSTNPKFGIRWEPIEGLALRGSYGTSFKAPLLSYLGQAPVYTTNLIRDSLTGGLADVLFLTGGNEDLGPEESESYSAGFDVRLTALPGLSLSATYFNLKFEDRIATPSTSTGLLTDVNDVLLRPFLTRGPALADVQAYFASPHFLRDFAGRGPAGVAVIADRRFHNMTATEQSGVDFVTAYGFSAGPGRLNVSVAVSHLLDNNIQPVPDVPTFTLLDTLAQPLEWKARGAVSWAQGRFLALVSINYANSYENTLFAPAQRIDSWTTGDLHLSYTTDDSGAIGLLGGITIALTVNNVTNETPPLVQIPASKLLPGQNPLPFDSANASPVGRFVSMQITKRW
jgi:outer membrane receptor protein involved in Fe transport